MAFILLVNESLKSTLFVIFLFVKVFEEIPFFSRAFFSPETSQCSTV